MDKKKMVISFLVIFFVIIGGYYVYNNEKKISENIDASVSNLVDPFQNMQIPEDFDEATRNVIQKKIDLTKKMWEEKPGAWETWISIGNLKRNSIKDYDGAIEAYKESIRLHSLNFVAYRSIAEIYKNDLKDYEKADEYYRLAIEIVSDDPELYMSLALLQEFQFKDMEKAEEVYLNGLNNTDNNFEIINKLLTFYKRNGNKEREKEIQQKINELYPDSRAVKEIIL
jgi:tetratricopeptide (TPR) repeat protein